MNQSTPKLNPKQIEAVLALSGPKRYSHFIKRVADWEVVWSLYDDGWAMAETDNGIQTVPFWPAEDYAILCSLDHWQGFKPKGIPLDEFMNDLLPSLKGDGVLPGIFPTPAGLSVTPTIEELLDDLNQELQWYA